MPQIVSRQLAHYRRNRGKINAAKRARRKAMRKADVKPKTALHHRERSRVGYNKHNPRLLQQQESQQDRQYLHRLWRSMPLNQPLKAGQLRLQGLQPHQLRYTRWFTGTREGVSYPPLRKAAGDYGHTPVRQPCPAKRRTAPGRGKAG